MHISPRTVGRDAPNNDREFVVGGDGKVYRAHPVVRGPSFAYQRKCFAHDMFREGWSKRRIAEECGVSAMTISRDLAGMKRDRVTGIDGKSYPAKPVRIIRLGAPSLNT